MSLTSTNSTSMYFVLRVSRQRAKVVEAVKPELVVEDSCRRTRRHHAAYLLGVAQLIGNRLAPDSQLPG